MTMPDEAVTEPAEPTEPVADAEPAAPPEPPPASAVKAEHVDFVAANTDLTADEAAAMTKADLIEQGQAVAAEAAPELPDVMAQHAPADPEPSPFRSATNESAPPPASVQTSAMRAHGLLSHLEDHLSADNPDLGYVKRVIEAARADLERYIPADVLQFAEAEAGRFLRQVL